MSRRIYEFRCTSCGAVTESLQDESLREIECPRCNDAVAIRAIVTPPRVDRLGMGAGKYASPESIDYFEKVHKQQKAIEERYEREHGDYGPRPGAD